MGYSEITRNSDITRTFNIILSFQVSSCAISIKNDPISFEKCCAQRVVTANVTTV